MSYPPLPPDDLTRTVTIARPDSDQSLPHVGIAGNTYTILIRGSDTAGRFTVIDMLVPPGGGPAPHRHDFEEMYTVLEGEAEFTFRGAATVIRAGETINIPANAPHFFRNVSSSAARLLCTCSPAALDEFFLEVGTPVATRTTIAPKLDATAQAEFIAKAAALGPKYHNEMLKA